MDNVFMIPIFQMIELRTQTVEVRFELRSNRIHSLFSFLYTQLLFQIYMKTFVNHKVLLKYKGT